MKINPAALPATIKLDLLRRPLMSAATAEECLDVNRQQLNKLIETGKIFWAWDMSLGRRQVELRILSACIVEQLSGPLPEVGRTKDLKLPEALDLVIPVKRQKLRGAEMQRWFHLNPNWFHDMGQSGELELIPENLPRTGQKASPHFTRASVAAFFEKRRIV